MAFKRLISINPATGKLERRHPQHTEKEIEARLRLASTAQSTWRTKSFGERGLLLKKAAKLLRDNKRRLSALAGREMGKVQAYGEGEIEKCAATLEFYAEHGEEMLLPESIETDASESFVRFDSLGVILAVMPWNFPFWQVVRAAAPALMAGNTMVLKHASNVQGCANALEKIFVRAFPKGVFVNLAIDSSRVERVIRDSRVAAVTLTGSELAGSAVARAAGDSLKKTVLELGGSDPFIVLADADVVAAAEGAVVARLQGNVGQSCISAKRFIVHEKVYDEFVERVSTRINRLTVGSPTDPKTHVGPMASEQMLLTIEKQVQDSVRKGATVAAGGKRLGVRGFFYAPTVLTEVKKGMPAYDDELFGPVLAVIKVKSDAEALRVANDTVYGLGSSLYTRNITAAKQIASRIDAGAVFINCVVRSDPRLPFGGVKKSGYGRELSSFGIREFVNIKTVYVK